MLRPLPLALVALLILAAPAWAQDALAALPGQVIGVSGSGDQLSLRLKSGEGERVLKIGEVFEDGWTLSALTATDATLTKTGQNRRIGLGLAGDSPKAPQNAPSQVTAVTGLLGAGGAAAEVEADPAAVRAETLAALDQRISDLRAALPPGQSSSALDYVTAERAKLLNPPSP
ncbi:MAG: hypothetical protein JWM33_1961 [Caulobacteraceae bacterium]|nr:hypothetical protein [Caulobacteraceae bacterium]